MDQQLPRKLDDSGQNRQPLMPESAVSTRGPYPPAWAGAYGWNGPMPPPFMRTAGMDWMGGRMMPHGAYFLDF